MPETILIDALFSGFPEGFCPTGPGALNEVAEAIINRTQWSLPVTARFYNYGDTEPLPEFRSYPWKRTIGGWPDRWYDYVAAAAGPSKWLFRHPLEPGMTIIAPRTVTTPAMVDTFGGGEPGIVTVTTGPFWAIDTAFTGRVIIGAGAIPGSNPLVTLNVGDDGGEAAHMQTVDEVGPHTHEMSPKDIEISPGGGTSHGFRYEPTATGDPHSDLVANTNTYTNDQKPIPLIQPVHARYLIVRTDRIYYRGT